MSKEKEREDIHEGVSDTNRVIGGVKGVAEEAAKRHGMDLAGEAARQIGGRFGLAGDAATIASSDDKAKAGLQFGAGALGTFLGSAFGPVSGFVGGLSLSELVGWAYDNRDPDFDPGDDVCSNCDLYGPPPPSRRGAESSSGDGKSEPSNRFANDPHGPHPELRDNPPANNSGEYGKSEPSNRFANDPHGPHPELRDNPPANNSGESRGGGGNGGSSSGSNNGNYPGGPGWNSDKGRGSGRESGNRGGNNSGNNGGLGPGADYGDGGWGGPGSDNGGGEGDGGSDGGGVGGACGPIVLDLDDDGVELVAVEDSTAAFFSDDEGFKYRSGWAAGDDGLLVYDRDGDGIITANEEVSFVEYVIGRMDKAEASRRYDANGDGELTDMEALRHFDSNGNGKLDSGDAEFGKFKVWRDVDQDGVSDSGEVRALSHHNIGDITLSYDANSPAAKTIGGNKLHGLGSYRRLNAAGGSLLGKFGDVAFGLSSVGVRKNAAGHYEYKTGGEVHRLFSNEGSTIGTHINFAAAAYNQYFGAIAGSGNDLITASLQDETGYFMNGGAGNDGLMGGGGDDVIIGGAGNDYLIGSGGNDIIIGGAGSDQVRGNEGNDILFVDSADLYAEGGSGYDMVFMSDNAAVTWSLALSGVEAFFSGGGNDTLSVGTIGDAAKDGGIIDGGGGKDTITGGASADILVGGDGADTVSGGDGDDVIVGGDGADTLNGGAGDDLFMGDSSDSVNGGEGWDTVIYAGDGAVTVNAHTVAVERLILGDGNDTVSANTTSASYNLHLYGGGGDDTLQTGVGADVLHGGKGNDKLRGGYGNDLYLFNRGDGRDEISDVAPYEHRYDGGKDTLSLGGGIALTDLVFYLRGGHLEIGIKGAGDGNIRTAAEFDALTDRITIKDWVNDKRKLEYLSLSDGTAVKLTKLVSLYRLANGGVRQLSTEMARWIRNAAPGSEVIQGTRDDDTLSAYGDGVQSLYGGYGNDLIYGMGEGGVLDGYAGTDKISYRYAESGVVADLAAGTAAAGSAKDTLSGFENIEGSAFGDSLTGTAGANEIDGGAGNDVLQGGAGDDVYYFGIGYGNDVIQEDGGGNDEIRLGAGISASSVRLVRNDLDLCLLLINSDGKFTDSLRVKNHFSSGDYYAPASVESLLFADGTRWGAAEFAAAEHSPRIRGSAGNNDLAGTVHYMGDVFDSDAGGNDDLHGYGGDDVYYLGAGTDHDVIREHYNNAGDSGDEIRIKPGIDVSSVSLMRSADALHLYVRLHNRYGGVWDSLKVEYHYYDGDSSGQVESILFADGTRWGAAEFAAAERPSEIRGGKGHDWLHGTDYMGDVFDGDAGGNDKLLGYGGDDVYYLGLGTGHDVIMEHCVAWEHWSSASGGDEIRVKSGIAVSSVSLVRSGDHLDVRLLGTDGTTVTDSLRVEYHFWEAPANFKYSNYSTKVEKIRAGGKVLLESNYLSLINEVAAFRAGTSSHSTMSSLLNAYWQDENTLTTATGG